MIVREYICFNDVRLLADDFEGEFEPRTKKAKTKEVIKKDAIKQGKSERKSPAQRYMYVVYRQNCIFKI